MRMASCQRTTSGALRCVPLLLLLFVCCSRINTVAAQDVYTAQDGSTFTIPSASICGWLDSFNLQVAKCGVVALFEDALLKFSSSCGNPNTTAPYNQIEPLSKSLSGSSIPAALSDLRPLPATVADSVIDAEGATYYWYYRVLHNLEAYTVCAPSNGGRATFLVPKTWSLARMWSLPQRMPGQPRPRTASTLPFAAVLTKLRTKQMVVVIRGTLTGFEWGIDFAYNQTTELYPGLGTHSGMSFVSKSMSSVIDTVTRRVASGAVNKVAVTGHSLGAGVSTIFAYGLQLAINNVTATRKLPSIKVDTVLFAPPNVGNSGFVASFNKLVNARRIAFQNDIVPQIPCIPSMVACADTKVPTNVPNDAKSWPYITVGATVPVTNTSMPVQQAAWGAMQTVSVQHTKEFLSATHVCSYSCFTAKYTGDKTNYCLLQADGKLDGTNSYCNNFPAKDYP